MILNQTLCSPVQKESREEEKKRKAALNEENGWGPAGETRGSGKSHTQKFGLQCRLTQLQMCAHSHIPQWHRVHVLNVTHIQKEADNHTCYHDTNGLWLESISQKTSGTNGNHISGPGAAPEGERLCLTESFFSTENKYGVFHLYYFIQLPGEQSTTKRKDGKHEVTGATGVSAAVWATGFRVPPWPMTTWTSTEGAGWLIIHMCTPQNACMSFFYARKTYTDSGQRWALKPSDCRLAHHWRSAFIWQHRLSSMAVKWLSSTSGLRNNK